MIRMSGFGPLPDGLLSDVKVKKLTFARVHASISIG